MAGFQTSTEAGGSEGVVIVDRGPQPSPAAPRRRRRMANQRQQARIYCWERSLTQKWRNRMPGRTNQPYAPGELEVVLSLAPTEDNIHWLSLLLERSEK